MKRLYRQWPHENTKARSIRQLLHDLHQIRLLSRYGEDVEVPPGWFYLKTGQIIKGWLWDMKQEDNDDMISILVERSENIAKSSDLAYVHGSMVSAVIIERAELNGFQLPPFTFDRRIVGPDSTRNEVSRRSQELSKTLSEFIQHKLHLKVNWDDVPENQRAIAMVQEVISRFSGALTALAYDSQLRSAIRRLDAVVIGIGPASDIEMGRNLVTVTLNIDDKEPAIFERNSLREQLRNLLLS